MKLKQIYNEVKVVNVYSLNEEGKELINDYYKFNELFERFSYENFDEDNATDEWGVAFHISELFGNEHYNNFKITFEKFKEYWINNYEEEEDEIKEKWNDQYLPYLKKI